ncbi:MAG: S41 family peptidase [Marinifilaceae bacterium]|nr:S41 family peptidase [Marinifilaceae bacterium]
MNTNTPTYDPIQIFDEAWELYNKTYSLFEIKGINWQELYHVYRQFIYDFTTEKILFETISMMLENLNDSHVQLKTENPEMHSYSGSIGKLVKEYNIAKVKTIFNSLPSAQNYFFIKIKQQSVFSYAWLEEQIAYLHISKFADMEETKSALSEIYDELSEAKALIVDIRRNKGGDDKIGKMLADCFADKKREYLKTKIKKEGLDNEYSEQEIWTTEPNAEMQFTQPVCLLIDQTTYSAAENFALAMREFPQVELVGDTTAGAYADADWKTLSNGWKVCIPFGIFTDKNDFCWEGIGLSPNYRITQKIGPKPKEYDALINFSKELLKRKGR